MVSREDLDSFLRLTEVPYEELDEGIWMVPAHADDPDSRPAVVVSLEPPVVVFRTEIRSIPDDAPGQLKLYELLLELNAKDLVHGAYGLEDGAVVLGDTLELENLDFSEFRASLESLTLAVTTHWQQLTTD